MAGSLGRGRREKIGDHIAIGYLTTDTVLGPAHRYSTPGGTDDRDLHVDAELCVELGSDIGADADADAVRDAIAGCWPALEIVDLSPRAGEPGSIVADNVFHVAAAFAETLIPLESGQQVVVYVNRERQVSAPWPPDIPDRIASAATIVAAFNERLRVGDRIITGSIIQVLSRSETSSRRFRRPHSRCDHRDPAWRDRALRRHVHGPIMESGRSSCDDPWRRSRGPGWAARNTSASPWSSAPPIKIDGVHSRGPSRRRRSRRRVNV